MNKSLVVGVAGAGAMGSGIAQVAAFAGCKVVLMDSSSQALDKARSSIEASCEKLVARNKISSDDASRFLESISFSLQIEDFASCELVIEAIIEDIEIKKSLFSKIEKVVTKECILATNTSSLSVVSVASGCEVKSRVVGIHFFNPPFLMPLVEIIPAFTTSNETTQQARSIIDSWGKITVLAKDTPGFIVNRIARPYYGEALKMYEEGIADFATIDWAMKEFGGFKMGPFELMDFIGNDVNYKVTETVWEQLFYDPRYTPSITQKRLYEAGLFGKKSGRGYYSYVEGSVLPQPDKNPVKGKYIFERILSMLINEAADALYLGIASKEDIEIAMTKGVNYPKGLLKWADEFGLEKVLRMIEQLQNDYLSNRYRPSLLLRKMVAEKRSFF